MFLRRIASKAKIVINTDEESKESYVENDKSEKLKKAIISLTALIDGLASQELFILPDAAPYEAIQGKLFRKTKGYAFVPSAEITKKLNDSKINFSTAFEEFKESPDVDMGSINLLVEKLKGFSKGLKTRCIYAHAEELTAVMRVEINVLLESTIQICAEINKVKNTEAGYQPPAPR
jgi:hypothetical protein